MKIERRRNTLLSIMRRIQDAREIRMEKSEKKISRGLEEVQWVLLCM